MRNVVFVKRQGGYKSEDGWACSSEGEALSMQKWLRHLGIKNVDVMTLQDHERLPERQPED